MRLLILTGCCIILPGWHISLLTGVNGSEVIVSQGQWYLPFFFLQTLCWGDLAGFPPVVGLYAGFLSLPGISPEHQ